MVQTTMEGRKKVVKVSSQDDSKELNFSDDVVSEKNNVHTLGHSF